MKKLITLVSTVSFFVSLGFVLQSFLLVLLRGNAKTVSRALVPPAVYKALNESQPSAVIARVLNKNVVS